MPTPRDYDSEPERYRLGVRVTAAHCAPGVDLQARIVDHLLAAGVATVLDAGCGDGALAAAAASRLRVFALDAAVPMVGAARAHGPVVRGDVTALPVADTCVDAVALREARRVLRPDGGTVARSDSPSWHRSGGRRPELSTPRTRAASWRPSSERGALLLARRAAPS
jgi:SAM-dependent methyltransferase